MRNDLRPPLHRLRLSGLCIVKALLRWKPAVSGRYSSHILPYNAENGRYLSMRPHIDEPDVPREYTSLPYTADNSDSRCQSLHPCTSDSVFSWHFLSCAEPQES